MRLDPQSLLDAYSHGASPMADEGGRIQWYTANPRGVIPLDAFHLPQTLRQTLRQKKFEIRINHDFEAAMRACMNARAQNTWINDELIFAYVALHRLGHAHSVEAWRAGRFAGRPLGGGRGGGGFSANIVFHQHRARNGARGAA